VELFSVGNLKSQEKAARKDQEPKRGGKKVDVPGKKELIGRPEIQGKD